MKNFLQIIGKPNSNSVCSMQKWNHDLSKHNPNEIEILDFEQPTAHVTECGCSKPGQSLHDLPFRRIEEFHDYHIVYKYS